MPKMKIDYKLLPVKAHFFFFMAGMGPVLPFLPVFAKQLGVSEVVMGIITSVLPIMFLLAKPLFGFILDKFQTVRKALFLLLLITTSVCFALLGYLPLPGASIGRMSNCSAVIYCQNKTLFLNDSSCERVCPFSPIASSCADIFPQCAPDCHYTCGDQSSYDKLKFYKGIIFWLYVIFMSLGSIGFNVINSISDAICFDVLGEGQEKKYGNQRVWGTFGFGIAALLGGYAIDVCSGGSEVKDYSPAFLLALACMMIDTACCFKLKLPPLPKSENILRDMVILVKKPHIVVFLVFTILVGVCDSVIIYYLFWFLEDLADANNYVDNIKLLEGLTIAAETLGAEVLFFMFSGKILAYIGYGHCLSLCFLAYGIRLGLLSMLQNPWWVLPIELVMQGPTYALCYTTIVAYASAISPPGTSATTQGLVAGLDDGLGYAIGSLSGGFLYKYLGGNNAFKIYSGLAFICSIAHAILYMVFRHPSQKKGHRVEYKTPKDASESVMSAS